MQPPHIDKNNIVTEQQVFAEMQLQEKEGSEVRENDGMTLSMIYDGKLTGF